MLKNFFKTIVCLGAAVMAVSAAAFAEGEIITFDGKSYVTVGENLFTNGDFSDNSGEGMEIWYTGKNSGGHSTVDNYIPNPKAGENLTKLTDGRIVLNEFEPIGNRIDNGFYFGKNGDNTYLVENVPEQGFDWKKCTWNGEHSLMAFVPIEKGKRYYFSFECCTSNGRASARYGTINSDDYVVPGQGEYANSMKWQSVGLDLNNGGAQNIGGTGAGRWAKWDCVLEPTNEADFFLFNTYWLQMSAYLSLDNFELYEIEELAPTITAELGWNNGGFTIDFLFGGVERLADKTISVEVYNGTEFVSAVEENITGDFSLRPGNGNNFYKAEIQAGGVNAESEPISVYSLLTEDISSNLSRYTAENVNKERIAAVNEVLKNGGFAVVDGEPTAALMKLMDKNGINTYTLKAEVTALGIYFAKDNDDGKYDTIEINGNEAMLSSSVDAQTVEIVMALDAVQLEFVPEVIEEEFVDNKAEIESGSYEYIM